MQPFLKWYGWPATWIKAINSFRKHMLTQHSIGIMSSWNKKNIIKAQCQNQSSASVTHLTPHVAYVTPIVTHGINDFIHHVKT